MTEGRATGYGLRATGYGHRSTDKHGVNRKKELSDDAGMDDLLLYQYSVWYVSTSTVPS